MMWHIGQKVVCINDTYLDPGWQHVANKPVKGQVYTIRDIYPDWFREYDCHDPAFLLEEITNPPDVWSMGDNKLVIDEVHFWCDRFKPLEEKKTDISAFTSLLKTKELEHV